jgi:hypothetical protein
MGERVYKKRKKEGEEVKMEKYITVNKELIGKKNPSNSGELSEN